MEEIKQGRIINIISNLFFVEIEEKIRECTSRGVFKNKEEKPVVGDLVKVNVTNNQNTVDSIARGNPEGSHMYCVPPDDIVTFCE